MVEETVCQPVREINPPSLLKEGSEVQQGIEIVRGRGRSRGRGRGGRGGGRGGRGGGRGAGGEGEQRPPPKDMSRLQGGEIEITIPGAPLTRT